MAYIFGGDTGLTYEQMKQARDYANRIRTDLSNDTPQNWGQGLGALLKAFGARRAGGKAEEAATAGREGVQQKASQIPALQSLFGGGLGGQGFVPSQGGGMSAAMPQGGSAGFTGLSSAPQEARAAPGADAIRAGLVRRGLPEHVADAFVMNFQDESGLNPGINEQNPLVEGSRGGFGLAQWTGPRRRQLEAFAQQRGAPVSDMDTQLDFLMMELQGPEAKAAQSILSAQDTPTAASAIVNNFLRPAEEHRARREAQYLGGAQPSQGQPDIAFTSQMGGVDPRLAELMSDPYVSELPPAQQSALGALWQQQMQNADPYRQLQMQKAQLELQQMQQPDPWAGIQEIDGQLVRMGANGPEVVGDFRANEQYRPLTPDEATQMGLPPDGNFQVGPDGKISQIGGGGVTVNNNMPGQGPELGKLSTDHGYILDPATGQPVIDPATGLPTAAPVPGSPAAREIEQQRSSAAQASQSSQRSGNIVSEDIGRVIDMIEGGRNQPITGATGRLARSIPGTEAYDAQALTETIRANIGFDRLQQMREESPTGGALGQVTERELATLQAVMGNLDLSQSREQLMQNLRRLDEVYNGILEKAARTGDGTFVPRADAGQTAQTQQGDGWQDMGGGVRIRRRN